MTTPSGFDWQRWSDQWDLAPGVTYLNHGSFGPSPRVVQENRLGWIRQLESEPMDFFVRRLSGLLEEALDPLAKLLNCPSDNLVCVPNATSGMNVVAANLPLSAGDEVLLTDHEYGAVVRIWGQACRQAGGRTVLARLPRPLDSIEKIVDAVFEKVNDRTKLIVVSHVTSQTAVVLPVREICEKAKECGVPVCIDGPHALGMVDVDLREIDPDFYAASCHKWISAPFGTGFLYVRSRHKQGLKPNVLSWGRSLRGAAPSWKDEFHWPGTFDPTPYLAVPAAIGFLDSVGIDAFREQTHALARHARERLLELSEEPPLTPDDPAWYRSMVTVPFASLGAESAFPGDIHPLQRWLWEEHRIEVPVIGWHEAPHVRVSCHLYNTPDDVDRLIDAIAQWRRARRPAADR